MPIGLTFPLAKNSGSLGYLAFSSTEKEAVSYNLKSLVLTNWGERPCHFYLGCNLREFIFGQLSEDTIEQVQERIESQVAMWLPYVSLKNVDIKFPSEIPNGMRIVIQYSLKGRQDLGSVLEIDVVA
jgi:phage baseplate assembly protein W